MASEKSRDEKIEKLYDIIFQIHRAMLVTQSKTGALRSRPMGVHLSRLDDSLWLFTNRDTAKVLEIMKDSEVNVSFSCAETMRFVSVSGVANLTDDRATIEQVWSPAAKTGYPAGKDDPELILIQVAPTFAEYWDVANDAFSLIYEATKAVFVGAATEVPGEHEKIKDPAANILPIESAL